MDKIDEAITDRYSDRNFYLGITRYSNEDILFSYHTESGISQ